MSRRDSHDPSKLWRQVSELIRPRPNAAIVACTPSSASHIPLLVRLFSGTTLHLVTHRIADAEAARALLDREGRRHVAVPVHVGDGPLAAGDVHPDAVVLWLSGWEGHERVRLWLEQAAKTLRSDGHLVLVTAIRRGARTHQRMAEQVFGSGVRFERAPHGTAVIVAQKTSTVSIPARDHEMGILVEADVLGQHFVFRTGPGLFSHSELNYGTRLLLELLHRERLSDVRNVLDLGCGYGAIGIVLARQHPDLVVTMVDVDARATAAAEKNVAINHVTRNARVFLSDGLRQLHGARFDLIVSHFPLHIPKSEQLRLLTEAREALAEGGSIYLCSLCDYDLRPLLTAVFGRADTLCEQRAGNGDCYRVICAMRAATSPLLRTAALGAGAPPRSTLSTSAHVLSDYAIPARCSAGQWFGCVFAAVSSAGSTQHMRRISLGSILQKRSTS